MNTHTDVITNADGIQLVADWNSHDMQRESLPIRSLDFARAHCANCTSHDQAVEHFKTLCGLNTAGQGKEANGEKVPNGLAKFFSEMKHDTGDWWKDSDRNLSKIRKDIKQAAKDKRDADKAKKEAETEAEAETIHLPADLVQYLVDNGLTTLAALKEAMKMVA